MKKCLLLATLVAVGTGLAACDLGSEDPCQASSNCHRTTADDPACMPGFHWEDPIDPDNYNCIPLPESGSTAPTSPGDGATPAEVDNGGCPPNSHLQDDACYCDEGFMVNADQTGCVESDGSDANCPPNSHYQDGNCYCDEGYGLNADQTGCVAECESDTDCAGAQICEDNACREPRCTEDSCPEGTTCDPNSGYCLQDIGSLPPQPNLSCNVLPEENCAADDFSCVPSWECTGSSCSDLVAFDPREGNHYWDYVINNEGVSQYRSYIRKDVRNLVKYASAWVRCMTDGRWSFGNGAELALGDMSEANGDIPGTAVDSPGHPQGTHVDGHDMDIGYYQTLHDDNRLRSICAHTSGGQEQYHCVDAPNNLDVWRTALVLAKMHDTPNLRVIGVDGQAGVLIESAITQMCSAGWISGNPCNNLKLAWEVTDNGHGWFRFHHHHFHISVSGAKSSFASEPRTCLAPSCAYDFRSDPRHLLYREVLPRLHH